MMDPTTLPVACRLSDAAQAARRATVLQRVGQGVQDVQELADGYAYRFPADEPWLSDLLEVIRLERECCAFLRFRLTAEPDHGPLWLELTGPAGTKEFLTSFFK